MSSIFVHKTEVFKLLSNINTSKATGPNEIIPKVLKQCASSLCSSLSLIFNISLNTGKIPMEWKDALVVPLYKKASQSDPKNYRPVSLTSLICKLLEKIVRQRVTLHLEKHSILIDNQHGFRNKRSCDTQLQLTLDDWYKAIENKQNVDVIYLDISRAFTCVPHNRVLSKLYNFGIKGSLLGWFRSFLKERRQRVRVNNRMSEWVEVTSGVPQGTILGPLIFLLYINDIADDLNATCRLFADDCLLYKCYSEFQETNRLQEDLNKLEIWSNRWLLEFNPSKCKVMYISNRKSIKKADYFLNGQKLESVEFEKYLGVYIQSNLKWSKHVNYVYQDSMRKLGFLKRSFNKCEPVVKENLYNQLIRSKLEYASSVWDPHNIGEEQKIEKIQKRAYKYIYGVKSIPNYILYLKEYKILPLHQRRVYNRLCMLYKIINGLIDINFDQNLTWAQGRCLRKNNTLQIKTTLIRTDNYKYSFFPRTINDWNALPDIIVKAESIVSFKQQLSEYFLKTHADNCKICFNL